MPLDKLRKAAQIETFSALGATGWYVEVTVPLRAIVKITREEVEMLGVAAVTGESINDALREIALDPIRFASIPGGLTVDVTRQHEEARIERARQKHELDVLAYEGGPHGD